MSSKWEWPIQQRPPTASWKVCNKAIGIAFTEEEDITHQLGEWYDEGGHQKTEWHLDAREGTLYRCKYGKWERHKAKQRGRLRFENECVTVSGPQGITHKAQATIRSSYIEVERLFSLGKRETTEENEPAASHYQSEIGDSFQSLPKHVRRLVGNIPKLTLPADLATTEPQYIIVATHGSVLFDVGYHSWVVSTKDEEIIISGGGPDDGAPNQMTSYRSELGGVCAGMAVIGTIARSEEINIRSVRFVCDNEAEVKLCNQKQTKSMFHNTEGDWDLVSTYRDLKRQWCNNIDVSFRWVKGHADREGRPLTTYERLNVEADLLADQIREEARGVYGARPNCPHCPIEKATLFIRRKKITSNMKYHLTSQLNDTKLRANIMLKE
jgi:ribonuclease HI